MNVQEMEVEIFLKGVELVELIGAAMKLETPEFKKNSEKLESNLKKFKVLNDRIRVENPKESDVLKAYEFTVKYHQAVTKLLLPKKGA